MPLHALLLCSLLAAPAAAPEPAAGATEHSPPPADPEALGGPAASELAPAEESGGGGDEHVEEERLGAADAAVLDRLGAVEERLQTVEEENERLKRAQARARRQTLEVPHLSFADNVRVRLRGYADVGAFYAFGDGVAYVRDAGKSTSSGMQSFPWLVYPDRPMPDVSKVPWVFFGDPWANPVNSQGDPADLGLDRTVIPRFDPIASGGGFSFLVNMVNAGLVATIGDDLLFELNLNLEPRQGVLGSPGDLIDVDLAYLEWMPVEGMDLHLFVGKFESTFGREYRIRQAPDRVGITPSLISRYTVGTPTGVKIRGGFFGGAFTYNFALTNGAMMTERFAHFMNEIDKNSVPTASGRISFIANTELILPIFFEIGFSGLAGSQDLQPALGIVQWQAGVDAKLVVGDLALVGEYLRGVAPGGGVVDAASLDFEGGYLEGSYLVFPWLTAITRLDYRRALLFASPNLYITDVGRATVGARFDITWNLVAKVEYLRVQELTGPEINDDVLTSSFLFRF